MVAAGIVETHGLDEEDVVDYLAACGGIGPEWSRDSVAEVVAAGYDRASGNRA
jgi:hypothetical protein